MLGLQSCQARKVARIAILLGLQRCHDRNVAVLAGLPGRRYCWAPKVARIAILLSLPACCQDRNIADAASQWSQGLLHSLPKQSRQQKPQAALLRHQTSVSTHPMVHTGEHVDLASYRAMRALVAGIYNDIRCILVACSDILKHKFSMHQIIHTWRGRRQRR